MELLKLNRSGIHTLYNIYSIYSLTPKYDMEEFAAFALQVSIDAIAAMSATGKYVVVKMNTKRENANVTISIDLKIKENFDLIGD